MIICLGSSLWAAESQIKELESRISVLEEYILPLIGKHESFTDASIPNSIYQQENKISIELVELSYHESNAANDYANDYSDWISL